jgi:YHS domain-containing protein
MHLLARRMMNSLFMKGGEPDMENTVRDLVCGMDIHPKTAAGKSDYGGQTYYFCSIGCKKAFDKEPEKYIHAQMHASAHGHHH